MTSRRGFLGAIAAAIAGAAAPVVCAWCKGTGSRSYAYKEAGHTFYRIAACDACGERALWVPGRKLISVPKPRPPQLAPFTFRDDWERSIRHLMHILDKYDPGFAAEMRRDHDLLREPRFAPDPGPTLADYQAGRVVRVGETVRVHMPPRFKT